MVLQFYLKSTQCTVRLGLTQHFFQHFINFLINFHSHYAICKKLPRSKVRNSFLKIPIIVVTLVCVQAPLLLCQRWCVPTLVCLHSSQGTNKPQQCKPRQPTESQVWECSVKIFPDRAWPLDLLYPRSDNFTDMKPTFQPVSLVCDNFYYRTCAINHRSCLVTAP